MICEICNRIFKNAGCLSIHRESCLRRREVKSEIIRLYTEEYVNIKKLAKKYRLGKKVITDILGDTIRTASEAAILAKKLYPESFKHSDKTKSLIREKRLEWMKNNPEKTAWRQANLSYPEKIFLDKIKELEWDKKYLIIREKSFHPYFVDFAFDNEMIAVEIDGSQHELEERKRSDELKDALITSLGWKIIRFTAHEIKTNIDGCIEKLTDIIDNREIFPNVTKVGIFRNREIKSYCSDCGKENTQNSKRCLECDSKDINRSISQRTVKRPPYDQLLKEVNELGYVGTGRKYGVSDNSIRNWIKFYKKELFI